jgi:hypothetical protein
VARLLNAAPGLQYKAALSVAYGARSIDPDKWVAKERPKGPSMWGHDRTWLPEDARDNARKLRMQLAEQGYRRPVQVMEGNYQLAPGAAT